MYAGLVDAAGDLQLYDGGPLPRRRWRNWWRSSSSRRLPDLHRRGRRPAFLPQGALLQAARLSRRASTAWVRWRGSMWPTAAARPEADAELGRVPPALRRAAQSAFLYHYARLIEALYALGAHGDAARRPRDPQPARARLRRRERARRRRHHRGAARRADPSLQGGRERRHALGQPDRRHRPQQPGHRQRRRAGGQALRRRQQAPGRHAQPRLGAGARLRPLPELLHPRPRPVPASRSNS